VSAEHDPGAELENILEYLQGLGWEEVYLPPAAKATGAGGAARVAASRAAAPRAAPSAAAAVQPVPGGEAVAAALSTAGPVAAVERAALLAGVGAEALACSRCRLAAGRRTVVFASGNPDADLMFVGEGPGAEEDRQGLPFVGPAGQLLTKIIQAIGLAREEVYIANVVKCRPPGNRDPQPDEVAACRPFLEAQVRLVRPKVLVALGRVAAQTLLGTDLPVARMRGHWHELFGVPLRVTYHPAAILRDAGLKRPTWEDMQRVRDRLTASS
jgi:DNA polymerase